jgi:hypothetical protein
MELAFGLQNYDLEATLWNSTFDIYLNKTVNYF